MFFDISLPQLEHGASSWPHVEHAVWPGLTRPVHRGLGQGIDVVESASEVWVGAFSMDYLNRD
jgi:hypothetical protein